MGIHSTGSEAKSFLFSAPFEEIKLPLLPDYCPMFFRRSLATAVSTAADSIKSRLRSELKNAMLSKNSSQVNTLKMLQNEIINFEKSGKSKFPVKKTPFCLYNSPLEIAGEADYLVALQEVKDRYVNTLASYQQLMAESRRAEDVEKLRVLHEKEVAELNVLKSFLPAEYTRQDLINLLPAEAQIKTFPEAIKILVGKVDFTRISRSALARELRQIYQ